MSKVNQINYDHSLILHLITNVVSKIPGINTKENFNVQINDTHTVLDITFKPLHYITNVSQLARKVQDMVYFNVKKNFDLFGIVVNVKVCGDQ
ncbi:MAG: hypothetical protein LBP70_02165 [Mycoplasmataceae bacterium]|jgi:uncharacterized alkaline shock family protein YloU|nr:hypothetical protein [Mycoplasmataceae bacterium]